MSQFVCTFSLPGQELLNGFQLICTSACIDAACSASPLSLSAAATLRCANMLNIWMWRGWDLPLPIHTTCLLAAILLLGFEHPFVDADSGLRCKVRSEMWLMKGEGEEEEEKDTGRWKEEGARALTEKLVASLSVKGPHQCLTGRWMMIRWTLFH